MADMMSQEQIDIMLNGMKDKDGKVEMEEVKYHIMVCMICRKAIQMNDLNCHVFLSNTHCCNKNGHFYVSEEWIHHYQKAPLESIWREPNKISSKPRTKLMPKKTMKTTVISQETG
jgi:hypothetical protein